MKTLEWTFQDRTTWASGPWDQEPDKIQWPDEATGLPCLIVRNHMGALCGYVAVPSSHPWHGQGYEEADVDVHGGLTFSDYCVMDEKEHGICHIPEPGEEDPAYWLGFDCMHMCDMYPTSDREFLVEGSGYRDVQYVRQECASLAEQIHAARKAPL